MQYLIIIVKIFTTKTIYTGARILEKLQLFHFTQYHITISVLNCKQLNLCIVKIRCYTVGGGSHVAFYNSVASDGCHFVKNTVKIFNIHHVFYFVGASKTCIQHEILKYIQYSFIKFLPDII